MTTPSTTPVPSKLSQDLLFNAEKIDESVNSSAASYFDRFGKERLTLTGAVNSIAAVNPRGAWASGVTYALKDLVTSGGVVYICVSAHTSGATFAGDASRWGVFQGLIAGDLADTSSTLKGDALIGVKQPLSGAVARTQHDKNSEFVSITDFGSITGVAANDHAVFALAQAAAPFIEVPAGFAARVNSGLQYWKFFGKGSVWENGRLWSLSPFPQTGALLKGYTSRTYGKYESAAAAAFTANSNVAQTKENCQINGTTTSALAVRNDYDHAAFFASCYSYTPDILDGTSTYAANTITNAAIGVLYATGALKPGMFILTLHATPCLGEVQSVSGNVATVDGWYLQSTGAATTPANAIGAIVNPNNKVFGGNLEVSATGNGTTTGANRVAGLEIGVTTATSGTPVAGTYGVDLVSRGGSYMDLGFRMRGKVNYAFFSDPAGGNALYAFRADAPGRGLSVVDATVAPIEVQVGGGANTVFGVAPSGGLTISPLNTINGPLALNGNGQTMAYTGSANAGYTGGASGLAAVWTIQKNTATGRSGSISGTWNVGGADYSEYEWNNGLMIVKGSVVGFKADGTLTLTFSEALRFGIKSTDPAIVGGDTWGTEDAIGLERPIEPVFEPPAYDGPTGPGPIPEGMVLPEDVRIDWLAREADARNAIAAWQASVDVARRIFDAATMPAFLSQWQTWNDAIEAARQNVDRIAYCGKVPVNVLGAKPGDYLVAAVTAEGSITADAVPEQQINFEQYRRAVGRVNRILDDGRAEVAVMVH